MKRLILIESDTKYHTMFAYELKEVGDGQFTYFREPGQGPFACSSRRDQFFGQVSMALVTRTDLEEAKPIPVEAPTEDQVMGLVELVAGAERKSQASRAPYRSSVPEEEGT